MRGTRSDSVLASEIAEFLAGELVGEEVVVYGPRPAIAPESNSVIFTDASHPLNQQEMARQSDVLVLCKDAAGLPAGTSFIQVDDPKASLSRVVDHYFMGEIKPFVHPTAVVENGAIIGPDVTLAAGCYIGPEVTIGSHSTILPNVVIMGRVAIGKNCVIKPNCTIGSDTFDFVRDGDGWTHYPQVGSIKIGDDVWIGANSTIEKGALTNTVITNGARIDDIVQIGSGSLVGEQSCIAAGAIVCRDVTIGRRCWIAPRVVIRQRVSIADESVIPVGSIVMQDVVRREAPGVAAETGMPTGTAQKTGDR